MFDNQIEGNPTETGSVDANQQPSAEGGQPLTADLNSLKSQVEALTKQVSDLTSVSRALQGDKDRGVKKALEEVGVLRKQIEETVSLNKAGLNPEQIERELKLNRLLDRLDQFEQPLTAQPVAGGTATVTAGQTEVVEFVKEYGLTSTDPDVFAYMVEASKGSFKTPEAARLAAANLALKKARQPNPSAAQAPALSGGSVPTTEDKDTLLAEYNALLDREPFSAKTKALKKKLQEMKML